MRRAPLAQNPHAQFFAFFASVNGAGNESTILYGLRKGAFEIIRINVRILHIFVYTQSTPGQCLRFNKGKEDQGKVMIFQ